ncbi:MAG: hypothetical protein QF898_18725 [SAR202 cluster bacterium]|nr:hypothetical protein [SAR202 cluster bacterium]
MAIYSEWWINWAARHFAEEGQVDDRTEFERVFARKARPVGFPALDVAARIDPLEVRRRWGIPNDQPVVVLLPFPQGFGKGAFWPSMICTEPSRLQRAINVFAYRRFDYWSHIWHDCNDVSVVKALRAFCDRNGAYLLVKSRKKTPIPDYTRAVADKCLYDEQYYPATILEALSIANVCFNFYSGAVMEAIALGVPNVCITFSADDYNGRNRLLLSRHKRFFTSQEGGLFRFTGVSTAITIAEAIETLPRRSLESFAMDPAARQRYIDKYLSLADSRSAERLVDEIEHAVASPGVGADVVPKLPA